MWYFNWFLRYFVSLRFVGAGRFLEAQSWRDSTVKPVSAEFQTRSCMSHDRLKINTVSVTLLPYHFRTGRNGVCALACSLLR